MRVEQENTLEDPAGRITWCYRVVFPGGVPWKVVVVREGDAFYWSWANDPALLQKNRRRPFTSHRDALEAAVRAANDLETGMW